MILSDAAKIKRYKEAGVWGDATLDAVFRKSVRARPDTLAIADAPNRSDICSGSPKRLTYTQLNRAIEGLAGTFLGLGLKRDDVIAVQLPNVVEQTVVMLAALRAGLIITPLPIMWREHEIKTALPSVSPRALITMATSEFDHASMMRDMAFELLTVRFVLAFGSDLPDGVMSIDAIFDETQDDLPAVDAHVANALSANDIATITWAGGDCPAPVAVPRSHNQLIAAGLMPLLEAKIHDQAVILNPYLLNGLTAFGCFFVPWLLTGGTLVLHHPFDISLFVEQVETENVNFTGLPPTIIDVVKSEDGFNKLGPDHKLTALACIWPAPVMPPNATERASGLGVRVIDIRNINEMLLIARNRVEGEKPGLIPHGVWNAPLNNGQGPALLDARIKGSASLNNGAGSLLAGELLLDSPMMFDDYFSTHAASPRIVRDRAGFVKTGIRCVIIGSTEAMIDPIAHNDNVIVHGGLWISAAELDALYGTYDGLSDAAAFSFADPVMGERIMAAVVPNPGALVNLSDLVAHLEMQKVASYKMPDRLVVVKSIPRGEDGKVLRAQVLEEI